MDILSSILFVNTLVSQSDMKVENFDFACY
jgi:hypothetical protein